MREGDCIWTYTGGVYWPLDPRADEVDIVDIARSLSHQCRYAGHCNRFYSVAEHSVHVSHLVPREDALAGLLHDATEAYLVDVPRPIKGFLTNYKAIEALNWKAIAEHFGLTEALPQSVHDADNGILLVEKDALIDPRVPPWGIDAIRPDPAPVIRCWRSETAYRKFRRRFIELTT